MSSEFDFTPSFFNNNDAFEKYLGNTSYYLGLQNNVLKLVGLINPKSIIECGSAIGTTSIKIAETYSNIHVVGFDMRNDVVKIAQEEAKNKGLSNLQFYTQNMMDFANSEVLADFILLLYSFHHIIDPIDNKVQFLKNLYANLQPGAYVCIAETFIPDNADGLHDKKAILDLWAIRKCEGYASTFWSSLDGIDETSIGKAVEIGNYCANNEYLACQLVAERNEEYLIQPKWLIKTAQDIGFKIILNQPINIIEDRIILLQK